MVSNRAYWIAAQAGVVPLAIGEPGTGKTRSIETFARALGRRLVVCEGNKHAPEDFGGYPSADLVKERVKLLTSHYVAECEDAEGGAVLFLDEITTCGPQVQAAMLRLLTHHPANTLIMAAGNPPDMAANGFDLDPPAANRLCWLTWGIDVGQFCDGLLTDFRESSGASFYPILGESWRDWIGQQRFYVSSFLRTRPQLAQAYPKDRAATAGAWPSLRSWTNAAQLLGANASIRGADRPQYDDETDLALVSGCIGEPAALEFLHYRASLDLPDPESLLADPSSFEVPSRGDKVLTVLGSVSAAVLRNNTPDRWLAAWDVFARAIAAGKRDIVAIYAGSLTRNRPEPGARVPSLIVSQLRDLFTEGA